MTEACENPLALDLGAIDLVVADAASALSAQLIASKNFIGGGEAG